MLGHLQHSKLLASSLQARMNSSLPLNEIFYSLQGEGAQTGMPMIFIRLAGCNLQCSYCDTDFSLKQRASLQDILQQIAQYPCKNIVWTGGEPTLYLNESIVHFFTEHGYYQSIETNGTKPVPHGIHYITCSPKPEAFALLNENFPHGVDEFRFPFGEGIPLPPAQHTLPKARRYFLSPVTDPRKAIYSQLHAFHTCIQYILQHPEWQLSVQMHKLLNIQ